MALGMPEEVSKDIQEVERILKLQLDNLFPDFTPKCHLFFLQNLIEDTSKTCIHNR